MSVLKKGNSFLKKNSNAISLIYLSMLTFAANLYKIIFRMTNVIKIKKGLDIPLRGEAEKKLVRIESKKVAVKPTDFIDIFPKLHLKEGAAVKAGTPLFYDKNHPEFQFTSPVSGTIEEIKRGAKRKILEIKITADGKNEYLDFPVKPVDAWKKEEIIQRLLESGVWVNIRQRPYNVIADPKDEARDIFISTFDSAPLAPALDFVFQNEKEHFQTGVDILNKLTAGKVYLGNKAGQKSIFQEINNAVINEFDGPHPAGNVGIQIHHIKPVNKGERVWVLDPQAVVLIGRLFMTGKYDARKIVALTGPEVKNPQYYEIINGTSLAEILQHAGITSTNVRYISGNVLHGTKIEADGYVGNFDRQITVIPEGNYYEFMGWAMPRFNKFSFSHAYFSWLFPKKKFTFDTNVNGGERPFILTGQFEKVLPMDIYPMQLLKAIIIKDLDLMENLGIYEVDEEDFALCEFVDASKNKIQAIIRDGLDFVRKEME